MFAKYSLCLHLIYVGLLQTAPTGNVCFECELLDNPDDCKTFHTCDDGENCYHEVIEAEDGSAKYSWGCASQQLCTLEMTLSYRPKRLGVQKCFNCCDFNFCNFGICKRDFCASVTCRNNATCTNTPLGHFCNCSIGYTGIFCEEEIDECSSDPCRNGATCTDYIGYYTCTCMPGYTGTNCEIDIDECISSPCANNSTCIDQIDGFMCDCNPGFTGTFCETNINECESGPCQYNSTCTDLVDGYVCNCIPGITGTNCEINIDDCENVTCLNNATCQDYIDDFNCLCQLGFTGLYCETSLGRVCYDCEDGVDDPSNCTNEVICGQNQECYTEHELTSVGVVKHNLGCVSRDLCAYYENLGIARRKRSKAIQLCYECCDENGCNRQACVESRSLDLWSV